MAGSGVGKECSYRCDLRVKPNATLYRLLGGWVYQRDAAEINAAIDQFRTCFEPKRYEVYEEVSDLPKIPVLRAWDFTYDWRAYHHRIRRKTSI